ncbi:MAG: hypothetical protein MRZ79_14005 [Bacteroidia bacterium]|nr:hypothetical protein [Bacteroidia bacterium]
MVAKTKASLTPPEHFKVAEQFYGFIHGESSSTILIQELEGTSYLLLKQGMTPEYFASQGFTYISAEDIITTSGLKGILYRMSFTVQETEFERLMLFAGDYHQTFWLVGNYPSMIKEQMFETMKNSLLTLKP